MSPILQAKANGSAFGYGMFVPAGAAGAFESIATTTVGSGGAASATFSSIPATFTHLQIRAFINNTVSNISIGLTINSDTGSNYSRHLLYGDGSSVAADGTYPVTSSNFTQYSGNSSNIFSGNIIDILDYANTSKNKTIRSLWGFDTNGAGYIGLGSGSWNSTSAISSITFTPAAGNFAQHSQFALYGIKGA